MRRIARPAAVASAAVLGVATVGLAVTTSQAEVVTPSYLVLETRSDGGTFTYKDSDSTTVDPEQQFTPDKCVVSGVGPLVELVATDTTKDAEAPVGFSDNGLGVKLKGPGTNCGQISESSELSLKLITGNGIPVGTLITDAEVDIESKFACTAIVEYFRQDSQVGSAQTIQLSDRSDCGPDSAGNDNRRAVLDIPSYGVDEIVFRPGNGGAISIEGGAESVAKPGGLASIAGTDGSVFELREGGRIIPEDGAVIIRDPSGAVAYIENPVSDDGLPIPYATEPCEGDEPGEPCVNFKLLPEAGDPDFYRLTAYVSIPIDDEGGQQTWDGKIDFEGNPSEDLLNTFDPGQLALGSDEGCQIETSGPMASTPQACITKFVYPDPAEGSYVNPALEGSSGIYRTDVWDLWLNDPRLR